MKPCRICRQNPRQPGLALCKHCASANKKEKERIKKLKSAQRREKHRERPAALKKKLDIVFSKYIRLRDKGNPCITCGKPWNDNFQCGHLFSRRHLATRWHEMNANAQCPGCNMFEGGRQYDHAIATDNKWGAGTAAMLRKETQVLWNKDSNDYKVYIEYYEEQTKALEEVS
jgi:hypothetical protein